MLAARSADFRRLFAGLAGVAYLLAALRAFAAAPSAVGATSTLEVERETLFSRTGGFERALRHFRRRVLGCMDSCDSEQRRILQR